MLGTTIPAEESQKEIIPQQAILIDPGNLDSGMLSLIEENNYSILGILVTHDHSHHVRGLKTIMKIYDTEIYAINPLVEGHRANLVRDRQNLDIGPFKVEVFSIPGHSSDSAIYRIDRLLFTGDVMIAGFLGKTASTYSAATQIGALREKLLSLPGDYFIFPGHGPPSTLEAERHFNLDITTFEQRQNRRSSFKFEFLG